MDELPRASNRLARSNDRKTAHLGESMKTNHGALPGTRGSAVSSRKLREETAPQPVLQTFQHDRTLEPSTRSLFPMRGSPPPTELPGHISGWVSLEIPRRESESRAKLPNPRRRDSLLHDRLVRFTWARGLQVCTDRWSFCRMPTRS